MTSFNVMETAKNKYTDEFRNNVKNILLYYLEQFPKRAENKIEKILCVI